MSVYLCSFQAHPNLEDVLIIQENEYCQSKHISIFFGVIYAYKGLLLVFGAFLAWETRNVSIPALNDSKHVGLSVYNVTMMCIMGAAIALIISDRKDAVFILISVFILFCTTATLCLVFMPKVRQLSAKCKAGVISSCTSRLLNCVVIRLVLSTRRLEPHCDQCPKIAATRPCANLSSECEKFVQPIIASRRC